MLSDEMIYAAGEIFFERMHRIVLRYLKLMGAHLRDIGRISATDAYRVAQMRRVAVTQGQIVREVAREAQQSVSDVHAVLEASARSDAQSYSAWALPAQAAQEMMAQLVAEQFQVTAGRMVNLANTTVVSEAYVRAVDVAVQSVRSGVTDYQASVRDVLREAAEAGLRVRDGTDTPVVAYEKGGTRRLDSAARQNVLDGVRDLSNASSERLGEAFGADGVEISAHMDCATDHLPWQGLQMSRKDFDAIQAELPRPYRMWNCRHHIYPIVLGVSKPAHTDEELKQMRERSQEQIEIDGRTKSRYAWTQEQRRIETRIRALKDMAVAAKAAEDMPLRRECQRGINDLTAYYERMSEAAGLPTREKRMSVGGFRAVKAE